jgi:small multidrug resistance pump
MYWVYLGLAIILEVCGTTFMKLSEGLSKLKFTIPMLLFYVISLALLSLSLKRIEVSVAYAVWSGVGIVLIAVVGILFFKEILTPHKAIFIALILIGVIGLNLSGVGH